MEDCAVRFAGNAVGRYPPVWAVNFSLLIFRLADIQVGCQVGWTDYTATANVSQEMFSSWKSIAALNRAKVGSAENDN
jgi:hypothetical protein